METIQRRYRLGCDVMMDDLVRLIKTFLIAIILGLFFEKFIFGFTIVQGLSMYPTLKNEDKLFINKFEYQIHKPHQGDIVIFVPPIKERKKELFIKRVIALEGDLFEILDGKIYINGEPVEEAYTNFEEYDDRDYLVTAGVVPEGMAFVMGDNRNDSNDSRCFGYVPIKSIKGRAEYRIWPVEAMTAFSSK